MARTTTGAAIVCLLLLSAASLCVPAELQPVEFARVGYIRADAQPEVGVCTQFDPEDVIAWDYGNRSLVIELPETRWITHIVVESDTETGNDLKLKPETMSIYTSMDNRRYVRYEQPFAIMISRFEGEPGLVWRVEFARLGLFAKYIKLKQTYNGPDNGFATSNLREAVRVYTDGSLGGPVSFDGLVVEPAQETGRMAAYALVTAPEEADLTIKLEAENTETWETVSSTARFTPGRWSRVTLQSPKLRQGGYRLTARLMHRDAPLAEKEMAFRVHTDVITDAGGTVATPPAGGAIIIRDIPPWSEGGEDLTYFLPHKPRKQWRGLLVPQGTSATISVPVSGECAAYLGVETPWPDLTMTWGENHETRPATQGDWPFTGGVQEVFAGYGDFSAAPLVIESPNGPCRISHVRIARLTPEEAELAHHVNDPTHNRRVIYNNDGFTELFGVKDWDKARLLALVERYEGTDTQIFEMSAWVSGAVSYPSEYATFWEVGEVPDDQWVRENDKMAVALYNQLEEDGIPIYPTLTARGQELGISVWGSLRMSAYYGFQEQQTIQAFNGKLWHEHQEMRIRNRDGSQRWELSFAWPQVRQERIGVLGELVEMGCEGVMMDFCRYPYILGYDEPLVEGFQEEYGVSPLDLEDNDERWISYRCELMNDFFRAVRKHIDEIGERQGRKLLISVRVPATGYREYGFDPQTWAKERLMDIFIPHYPGLQRDFDVRPWVAMARGTDIKVYPAMTPTKTQTSSTELTDAQIKAGVKPGIVTGMTKDDYRRKAWRRYRNGADGTFLFNIWTIGITRNLLGDKRSLAKWSYFEDPINLPRQDILLK